MKKPGQALSHFLDIYINSYIMSILYVVMMSDNINSANADELNHYVR